LGVDVGRLELKNTNNYNTHPATEYREENKNRNFIIENIKENL
jgi:hypothetical protein